MNLKALRAAALKAANDVADAAKAANRDLTDEEVATIEGHLEEVKALDERIEKAARGTAILERIASAAGPDDSGTGEKGATVNAEDRGSFGERFVKSAPFEAFRESFPKGVGSGSPINIGRVKVGTLAEYGATSRLGTKALTSPIAHLEPTRMPTVDLVDRNRLTFLDLVSRGNAAGAFEYVQVVSVDRGAKIVPEATSATDDAALKPLSGLTTAIADAKPYTYADGYEVTNQLLSDAPAFASYMNQELSYSIDSVIEDKLLNGTGTSGEPRGILNTTGVQHADYTAGADPIAKAKAIRTAMTNILRLPGGTVQAIVMSPEDDAEFDIMQDNEGRFFGQGPFGMGPGTLWGRPRVTSERVEPGTFILGDFKQVALLDVEGLSVLAFNQHKDFAQRNMTYVRAELRAEQVIWKPSRLLVVAAGA